MLSVGVHPHFVSGEQPVDLEAEVTVGTLEAFLVAVLEYHVLPEVAASVEQSITLLPGEVDVSLYYCT